MDRKSGNLKIGVKIGNGSFSIKSKEGLEKPIPDISWYIISLGPFLGTCFFP
jgi:hypothetical protein